MYTSNSAFISYCVAAFTGNTIWSATGFGHAIFYLLIYQVTDFLGLMTSTTLKYTILLQTIALMPSLLFVYTTNFKNIWKDFHWRIIVPMLIPEASLVYLGQYVQKFTDESLIRLIIGGFVLVVASLKIIQNLSNKKVPDNENEIENVEEGKLTNSNLNKESIKYPKFMVPVVITVGCGAGFLGGLIGASGPPLIIFFLFFSFPKGIIRTTGFVTTTNNLIARILSYLLTKPPQTDDYWSKHIENNSYESWFLKEDWPLYFGIAVCSILGTVVGSSLHKKLTPGKLDNILIFMLVVCSCLMLTKGILG